MVTKKAIIIIAIAAAAWLIFTWIVFKAPSVQVPLQTGGQTPTATPSATQPAAPAPAFKNTAPRTVTSASPAPPTGTGTAGGSKTTVAAGTNYVISPEAGAQWVIGDTNVIQWKKGAPVTGYVYLANAADGSVAGWLSAQTNANDTSLSWNTRDLFVSRTSALKKDVQPGKYFVKVVFNSPQQPAIASVPFSIVLPENQQAAVSSLIVKNGAFSQSVVSVKQGTQLIITNQDSVAYHIIISSFGVPIALEPGGSYAFDTSPLAPGNTYVFYSTSSTQLRASVSIK